MVASAYDGRLRVGFFAVVGMGAKPHKFRDCKGDVSQR